MLLLKISTICSLFTLIVVQARRPQEQPPYESAGSIAQFKRNESKLAMYNTEITETATETGLLRAVLINALDERPEGLEISQVTDLISRLQPTVAILLGLPKGITSTSGTDALAEQINRNRPRSALYSISRHTGTHGGLVITLLPLLASQTLTHGGVAGAVDLELALDQSQRKTFHLLLAALWEGAGGTSPSMRTSQASALYRRAQTLHESGQAFLVLGSFGSPTGSADPAVRMVASSGYVVEAWEEMRWPKPSYTRWDGSRTDWAFLGHAAKRAMLGAYAGHYGILAHTPLVIDLYLPALIRAYDARTAGGAAAEEGGSVLGRIESWFRRLDLRIIGWIVLGLLGGSLLITAIAFGIRFIINRRRQGGPKQYQADLKLASVRA